MSDERPEFEKHTPGPWFVSAEVERDEGPVVYHLDSRTDGPVGYFESLADVVPEDRAGVYDARLIAAAPDLLSRLGQLESDLKAARTLNNENALVERLHTLEGALREAHEVLGTMKDGPWPIPRLMVRLVRLQYIARRALQGSEEER